MCVCQAIATQKELYFSISLSILLTSYPQTSKRVRVSRDNSFFFCRIFLFLFHGVLFMFVHSVHKFVRHFHIIFLLAVATQHTVEWGEMWMWDHCWYCMCVCRFSFAHCSYCYNIISYHVVFCVCTQSTCVHCALLSSCDAAEANRPNPPITTLSIALILPVSF